jgi:hypothetical protein
LADRTERGRGVSVPTTPAEFPISTPASATTVDFILPTIMKLSETVGALSEKISAVERANAEISKSLIKIEPQLNDVFGFAKHTAPHLATKAELTTLESNLSRAIGDRPTSGTMLAVAAIILAVAALPFFPEWWAHVKADIGMTTTQSDKAPR